MPIVEYVLHEDFGYDESSDHECHLTLPGFDLFGYALVARSTNYVLGRGAGAD